MSRSSSIEENDYKRTPRNVDELKRYQDLEDLERYGEIEVEIPELSLSSQGNPAEDDGEPYGDEDEDRSWLLEEHSQRSAPSRDRKGKGRATQSESTRRPPTYIPRGHPGSAYYLDDLDNLEEDKEDPHRTLLPVGKGKHRAPPSIIHQDQSTTGDLPSYERSSTRLEYWRSSDSNHKTVDGKPMTIREILEHNEQKAKKHKQKQTNLKTMLRESHFKHPDGS